MVLCVLRATDILTTLQNKTTLTPEGKLCLEKFFDPFHDTPVSVAQVPDGNTRPTIVQEVRSSVDIVTVGQDLAINIMPFCLCQTAATMAPGYRTRALYDETTFQNGTDIFYPCAQNLIVTQPGTYNVTEGFIDVCLTPAGLPMYPSGGATSWSPPSRYAVPNMSTTASGARRLVAVGFELHNTTAELYRQGTITCYRKPVSYSQDRWFAGDFGVAAPAGAVPFGTGWTFASSCNPIGTAPAFEEAYMPPSSVGEAMALVGTTQWEAAKGAYSVATLCDIGKTPLQPNNFGYFAYTAGDVNHLNHLPAPSRNQDALCTRSVGDVVTSAGHPHYQFGHAPLVEYLPTRMNTTGLLATGLSTQTTFTLTIKAIWEFAPSTLATSGESLVWLARPPPAYDPAFIELYQETARRLPVAVPVSENPLGEWFQKVQGAIAAAVPHVGTLAPLLNVVPGIGPALAATARAVGDAASGEWGTGPAPAKKAVKARPRPSSAPRSRPTSRASSASRSSLASGVY